MGKGERAFNLCQSVVCSPRFVGGDAEDNANEKRGTPVARIVLGHTVR